MLPLTRKNGKTLSKPKKIIKYSKFEYFNKFWKLLTNLTNFYSKINQFAY